VGSGTLVRKTSWNWRAKLDNDHSRPSKMAYFLEKEAKNTIVFFCGEPFVNEICLVAMWDM
jgi:hypothetical protein